MTKKIISLILSLILAISCVPLSVFASGNDETTTTTSNVAICVESTWCNAGKYAEVNINILDNPGIAGAKFSISYDKELILVSATEEKGVFKELDYTAPETLTSPALFNWDSLDAVADEDGTIITLKFAVSNSVTVGDNLDVKVSYTYGDIYDFNLRSLNVTTVNGALNVIDFIPGDVNEDDVINGKDVTLIRRYNAGSNVDINLLAADVNDDGVINGKDVTLIRRVNAAWPDVKLQPGTPKCNHPRTAVTAKEATCTDKGNIAYWYCYDCDEYFLDATGDLRISYVETIVPAKGHKNVSFVAMVEPTYEEIGNIAYWHCKDCEKYYSDADCKTEITYNDTIIPAKSKEGIKYYLYDNSQYLAKVGVENPNPAWYDSEKGLKLENLEAEGYIFEGWYDGAGSNASQIKKIEIGETGTISLYAKWTPIKYNIEYKDAPKANNPTTYTIEDEIILSFPEWSGLSFAFWTDENEEKITKIEKGTTRNITLTAHWRSVQNLAVANQSDDFDVIYDEKLEQYYFLYELGTINNVVLNYHFNQKMDGTRTYSYVEEKTVRVEESVATSVAQTIIQSITQTQDWSNTTEKIELHSKTTKQDFTICPEIEIKGIKAKAWEYTNGSSKFDEKSLTEKEYQGEFNEENEENSTSISSIVSYVVDTSSTVKYQVDLHPDFSPKGMYNYVYAGDVRVFAIVTYDPVTENYYLDTYSQIYRTFDTSIFELIPEYDLDVNIEPNEPLSFDIPFENMKAYIDSSYYVQYDANGGEGTMPLSVMACGKQQTLPANQFTKAGYTFTGWKLEGEGTPILNQEAITDLADKGETITLVATWTPTPYKVEWSNGFHYSVTVERISSPHGSAATGKLNSGDTVYYGDELKITYIPDTGYSITSPGITSYTVPDDNIPSSTFKATASANKYYIVYNGNGATDGSMANTECTYDASTPLRANEFSRHGWVFAGWKDANGNYYSDRQSVINLTSEANGTITLYAQWTILTSKTYSCGDRGFDFDYPTSEYVTYAAKLGDYFNINDLINNGYSRVEIVCNYTVDVDGDHLRSKCQAFYGFMMSDGTTINNIDRIIFESSQEALDHDAYRSFSYSGSTNTSNLLNNCDYIGFSVILDAWGWMDLLNNGTVVGASFSVAFVK